MGAGKFGDLHIVPTGCEKYLIVTFKRPEGGFRVNAGFVGVHGIESRRVFPRDLKQC